jgi:hypothetical protein
MFWLFRGRDGNFSPEYVIARINDCRQVIEERRKYPLGFIFSLAERWRLSRWFARLDGILPGPIAHQAANLSSRNLLDLAAAAKHLWFRQQTALEYARFSELQRRVGR